MNRRAWSDADLALLREMYPHTLAAEVAQRVARSIRSVHQKAAKLGLRKTAEWRRSPASKRIQPGQRISRSTEFQPGFTPWSKGKKIGTRGRSAETQFKVGQTGKKWVPVGSLRLIDGTLEQKYADGPGTSTARWRSVHRLVWEREHGPVPDGSVVVFLPGKRAAVLDEITLDRLELISRTELMRRNTIYRYPEEIVQVIKLRGRLTRAIREKQKEHAA